MKTCVTTIFDTDDEPDDACPCIADRSNALLVGELRVCWGNDGENV